MKLVKATVDEFSDILVSVREELAQDLADGPENLFPGLYLGAVWLGVKVWK